jgi:hypothetical protein
MLAQGTSTATVLLAKAVQKGGIGIFESIKIAPPCGRPSFGAPRLALFAAS